MRDKEFVSRLRSLVDEFGDGRYSKFARVSGISVPTIQRYIEGRSLPGYLMIKSICAHCSINTEWLLFGKGSKYKSKKPISDYPVPALNILTIGNRQTVPQSEVSGEGYFAVPILKSISSRDPKLVEAENIEGYAIVFKNWLEIGDHIAVRIKDHSMHPVLNPGDLAGINMDKTEPELLNNKLVMAFNEGQPVIRELSLSPQNNLSVLLPRNTKDYSHIVHPADGIHKILAGQVEWYSRKLV